MKEKLIEFLELEKKAKKFNPYTHENYLELITFYSKALTIAPLAVNKLMEAVELLEKLEWSFDNDLGFYFCSVCRNEKQYGHTKDCKLKQFLEDFNNEN